MKGFEHWSYSQLQTYRACPYRARLQYIEHSPQPPLKPDSPLIRGRAVDQAVQDYLLDDGPLTDDIKAFEEQLGTVRELRRSGRATVDVQRKTYLDPNWRSCERSDYWLIYIPDIHVRTKDVNLTIDWKTGKKWGNEVKHYDQGLLYCTGEWCQRPEYDEYQFEDWYGDQKDVTAHVFTPTQLAAARVAFDKEVAAMFADLICAPRPNKIVCKYCPFGPRGTGACPVGV